MEILTKEQAEKIPVYVSRTKNDVLITLHTLKVGEVLHFTKEDWGIKTSPVSAIHKHFNEKSYKPLGMKFQCRTTSAGNYLAERIA